MLARYVLAVAGCVGLLIGLFSVVRAEPGASSGPPPGEAFSIGLAGPAYCSGGNPSCGRDPWWRQWNELQSPDLHPFTLTDVPLTVEARYLEAVHLLWAWDEGRALLRDGSDFGVVIHSGVFEREPTAIAYYDTSRRHIQVNPRYAQAATWMIAAVLSHELQHISDAHNRAFQGHVPDHCFARETRAYETESRFIAWYTTSLVGEAVPMKEVRKHDSAEFRNLGELLHRISSAPNAAALVREDYGESCTRNP